MTAGWDFAPACRPTVRRSPSPLGLGESHSFQRPVPKPPEPPVEAQSSQFNPSGSMSRKAGTGGARRHVDRRGRPRVRRAPEGGQDRGSSRRARPRPAGAPSAAERALRAIAAAKFDLGPRAREPRAENVLHVQSWYVDFARGWVSSDARGPGVLGPLCTLPSMGRARRTSSLS